MEIEKLPERMPEKKPEQSGQWLWKNLKPFGCILCLVIMVAAIVICLTAGRDPIPGYEPPMAVEYYAGAPEELKAELEANVLPHLEGIVSCEVAEGRVVLSIDSGYFAVSRSAVGQYFGFEIIEFVQAP